MMVKEWVIAVIGVECILRMHGEVVRDTTLAICWCRTRQDQMKWNCAVQPSMQGDSKVLSWEICL